MTKPILDVIEESVQDMRDNHYNCPFNNLELERGCLLCKLLFPETTRVRRGYCPCNRLGDSYVKAIMRDFFPVKEKN